ncbi:hypothetical protein HDV05_002002 [Chytridiales sp. JEL 0842]|nr:hypothetical protein HDV05_002002 [Chytridiales sp. JEL 0842]
MKELYPVVDYFLILESNSTFTGIPKPFTFREHIHLFDFAKDKIRYKSLSIRPLYPGENPFNLEFEHRDSMNSLIASAGAQRGDLILMTDLDEIPSLHTLQLLTSCQGVPFPLHLQLKNYIYSFEFYIDSTSWRAKMVEYPADYHHGRETNLLFSDAGWHCSFCFRYIEDFVFKMTGYSHADRVHSEAFLEEGRLQNVVCEGGDVFGMLPEVYTFRDLVLKTGKVEKQKSGVGLPAYLLENKERFRFLLPGGCMREKKLNLESIEMD